MKTIRFLLLPSAALTASLLGGCGTDPEPQSVVCTDFRAGADLSNATFGVSGDLQRPYVAFAQAAGDLASVANDMLHTVGTACEGLALELGASRSDPRVVGKLEPDAVRAWCDIAAEQFKKARPVLERANFAVSVVTPKCTVDTSFQVECEQRCVSKTTCTEESPEERCPDEAREGICPGTCTGTCTGSETAPAVCDGECSGTCFGTCGDEGDEEPEACSTGCVCTKTCKGTCTAACTLGSQGAACDALCSGGCSEPLIAPSCSQPLVAPKCAGDVDCQKSCSASGAARASCPEGSLAVRIDPEARVANARTIGALERHLPPIFLAARGRAKVLADGASDVLDAAGNILTRGKELGPMGAACGMLIGKTGEDARKSLNAAKAGSKVVANAITGDALEPAEEAD